MIAFSIKEGSILKSFCTSTNTGFAPTLTIVQTHATKEFGTVITSSPSPIPNASKLKERASEPFPTPIANEVPQKSAKFLSNCSSSLPKTQFL